VELQPKACKFASIFPTMFTKSGSYSCQETYIQHFSRIFRHFCISAFLESKVWGCEVRKAHGAVQIQSLCRRFIFCFLSCCTNKSSSNRCGYGAPSISWGSLYIIAIGTPKQKDFTLPLGHMQSTSTQPEQTRCGAMTYPGRQPLHRSMRNTLFHQA